MASSIVRTQHFDPYDGLDPSRLKQEFSGKSVLITGGGYGIGASISSSFAEAGVSSIAICGRSEDKLKGTISALRTSFPQVEASYYVVDISSPSSVQGLFANLQSVPDILVNNAGFLPSPSNFASANLDAWWEGFEINVRGTALVTQAFLQHRVKSQPKPQNPATILTLNTIGAYSVRVPNLSAYGASKAALARLMELVSVDVPETEARFVSIHPGAVKTAMATKSGLEGVFRPTDARLAANFTVWAASNEAKFLAGRFAWVNWDVNELASKRDEILEKDLLRTSLKE